MAGQDVIIEIRDLAKTYRGSSSPALSQLNLNIPAGEIFGLLGPNGAGKTTTVAILCGLVQPTEGTATIGGYNLPDELPSIRQIIGYVPQDIALYPSLTAKENLRFFGNMYGLRGKLLRKRIDHYLDAFGLWAHARKRVEQFSGGMKRRTNIIAALLHEPSILFLDEPTVGIDVQSRHLILETLKRIHQEGTTIIYTSHHMEEAQQFCSRIAIIDHGTIIKEGKPTELIAETDQSNNLEELFLNLTGRSLRE